MKYSVETNALAIGYGKAALARDIALGAAKGQVLALIGPNGAGKSTLLKTLAGQLAPLGGAVLLDGQELARIPGNARAQKLALMLPHTRRTELTTCFEFAAAGRIPYTGRLGILSAEDKKQVQSALELVGAAHLADRDFNCVSDGQRQRILLARAVCQQPHVLLLDEPTSFLDIKGKIELLTILQKLAHEQQLAVIVTLHELDMAQKIADAVVCVSPHGVSAPMPPAQAFARENIKALYGLTEAQYSAVFGPPKPEKPQFEHYVRSGQKLLRCGYTTGTCAALAAAGAARLLLTDTAPETVALRTPKGIVVEVAPLFCRIVAEGAECAIEKDGGDDVDVTTGLPVTATVTLLPGTPKADEAALIDRANGTVRLIEKKFTLDDKKDFYLSTRVFGCTEALQEKAKLKAVCETAVAAVKEAYPEPESLDDVPPFDGGTETAVELLVRNQAVDNQISVEDVRERIRENFPLAAPRFEEALAETGVQENDRVTVTPARIKKLESRSFKTESGIEIRIPAELCSSDDAVEFIHSATGGLSLLIKDVLV